jgi:hypothetical protein
MIVFMSLLQENWQKWAYLISSFREGAASGQLQKAAINCPQAGDTSGRHRTLPKDLPP